MGAETVLVRALRDQFVSDLKQSWQKTAVLGVLLLVGLVLWIPPLIRAMVGPAESAVVQAPQDSRSDLPPIEAVASFQGAAAPSAMESTSGYTWDIFDRDSRSDPLVRSVEVAAIQSDPFRMDHSQFPPPGLFAAEEKHVDDEKPTTSEASPEKPILDGLELKSTILGVKRRAALINKKLYFEGMDVRSTSGATFRLAAVHSKRVTLKRGNETFELKLATPSRSARDASKR